MTIPETFTSRSPVTAVESVEFLQYAMVGGERLPNLFTRKVLWLRQIEKRIMVRHRGVEIEEEGYCFNNRMDADPRLEEALRLARAYKADATEAASSDPWAPKLEELKG